LALREPYGAPLYPGCPGLLREASALTYAIEANNRAAPGYRRDSRNFIGRFGNLRDATVRTAANRLLPWRYIVRQVSGSAKRKQDASRANDRARLRIGYLIGLSRGQGCPGF